MSPPIAGRGRTLARSRRCSDVISLTPEILTHVSGLLSLTVTLEVRHEGDVPGDDLRHRAVGASRVGPRWFRGRVVGRSARRRHRRRHNPAARARLRPAAASLHGAPAGHLRAARLRPVSDLRRAQAAPGVPSLAGSRLRLLRTRAERRQSRHLRQRAPVRVGARRSAGLLRRNPADALQRRVAARGIQHLLAKYPRVLRPIRLRAAE